MRLTQPPSPMAIDTGWTANVSAGDKSVAITDYVNGLDATMVAALNVVSAGLGTTLATALDTVVLLRKKVQALETALATKKLPNA